MEQRLVPLAAVAPPPPPQDLLKANQGQTFKVPVIGDMAEKQADAIQLIPRNGYLNGENGRFVCLTESPRSGIPIYFRLWSGCSNYCRHAPGLERTLLKVRVFYHDKCFDGASSAAVFSRFYRERIRNDVEFVFSGLLHRAGALFNEDHFDGDENAIVDFKYSSSAKIHWWFDHHQSAFRSAEDAPHLEQQQR